MPFPTLSICQPWAWLILRPDIIGAEARAAARAKELIKDVENRGWESSQRGWVLLHASSTRLPRAAKNPEAADWDGAALFAAKRGVEVPLQHSLPHGAVVGAMRIDGCERFVASRWFCGPVGYRIGAAVPFASPVECKGTLKFFPLPPDGSGPGGDELRGLLAAQIRAAGLAREFGLVEPEKNFASQPLVVTPTANPNP